MAPGGRSIASAALLAVAFALFVPVFAQAATEFSYGGWAYGAQADTVLEYIPILIAVAALVVLAKPVLRGSK